MISSLNLKHYTSAAAHYPSRPKFASELFRPPLNSALSGRATFLGVSGDSSFRCFCSRDEKSLRPASQEFSALKEEEEKEDLVWDNGDLWTTLAFYIFTLHIPLSFGWMSVAAQILHQPHLDPQSRAVSLLVAQVLEVTASLILLKLTAKGEFRFEDFYKPSELSKERNWLFASATGFGFLFALVVLSSFLLGNIFPETKAMNNPMVKEMLVENSISKASCVFIYCITAPLLEETIYRGFLLRSLSSTMKWQNAIFISSVIFSAAHLSGENFVQLFIIGSVLGWSYCWTGDLRSSLAIHSVYNAMTLILTFLS